MASLTKRKVNEKSIWTVKYKGTDGKWKYKSCGADAKKRDANLMLAEYTNREFNQKHKKHIKKVSIGLIEALDHYIYKVVAKEKKTVNSIDRDQTVLKNFKVYCEKHKWKKFDDPDVQDYIDYRESNGCKYNTLEKDRGKIRRFYNWCIKQHYTNDNLGDDVELPKKIDTKPRFFTHHEIELIMNLSKEPYKTIWLFMLNTGLRSGEVGNLKWTDWIKSNKTLIIRVVDGDRKTRTVGNKTKKEGSIPLNPIAQSILLKLEKDKSHPVYVFTNAGGNQLDNDNLYRTLTRLKPHVKKVHGGTCNIDDCKVHTFRHTFASHLAIQGVSLFKIQKLLRHADIKQTQIYSHLSEGSLKEAVNGLDLGSEYYQMEVIKDVAQSTVHDNVYDMLDDITSEERKELNNKTGSAPKE